MLHHVILSAVGHLWVMLGTLAATKAVPFSTLKAIHHCMILDVLVSFSSVSDDLRSVELSALLRLLDVRDSTIRDVVCRAIRTSIGVFSPAHLVVALLWVVHTTQKTLVPLGFEM